MNVSFKTYHLILSQARNLCCLAECYSVLLFLLLLLLLLLWSETIKHVYDALSLRFLLLFFSSLVSLLFFAQSSSLLHALPPSSHCTLLHSPSSCRFSSPNSSSSFQQQNFLFLFFFQLWVSLLFDIFQLPRRRERMVSLRLLRLPNPSTLPRKSAYTIGMLLKLMLKLVVCYYFDQGFKYRSRQMADKCGQYGPNCSRRQLKTLMLRPKSRSWTDN